MPELDTLWQPGSAVLTAARIGDPNQRAAELRRTLRDNLFVDEYQERWLAFQFLARLSRWLDLRPYEDIFEEYRDAYQDPSLLYLLDDQELRAMAREDYVVFLRSAIQNGETRLPRGRRYPRVLAIRAVALEGISELQTFAETYYSQLPKDSQATYPIETFRMRLRLTAGAADRKDALIQAARRLQDMDECQFRRGMGVDKALVSSVEELAQLACTASPIDATQSPACATFATLWAREWRRGPDGARPVGGMFGVGHGWLEDLEGLECKGLTFQQKAGIEREREIAAAKAAGQVDEQGKPIVADPPPCPGEAGSQPANDNAEGADELAQ